MEGRPLRVLIYSNKNTEVQFRLLVAVQPAHGMNRFGYRGEYAKIQSPIFMFNGSRDGCSQKLGLVTATDLLIVKPTGTRGRLSRT